MFYKLSMIYFSDLHYSRSINMKIFYHCNIRNDKTGKCQFIMFKLIEIRLSTSNMFNTV